MQIALEPQAEPDTLFPRYLEGVEFARKTGRGNVKVMADLNYFIELDQPLEDILKAPGMCLNAHVQGDGGSQSLVSVIPVIKRIVRMINDWFVLKDHTKRPIR